MDEDFLKRGKTQKKDQIDVLRYMMRPTITTININLALFLKIKRLIFCKYYAYFYKSFKGRFNV